MLELFAEIAMHESATMKPLRTHVAFATRVIHAGQTPTRRPARS